jgi:hypothetical protein
MDELKTFLKEHKIDHYLYENHLKIFLMPPISSRNFLTLIEILTYNFNNVQFSVPFTYTNPYLSITWQGVK